MALLAVDDDPSLLRRLNSDKGVSGKHHQPNFQSLRRPDGPIKISPVRSSVRADDQPKPDRPDVRAKSPFGRRMDSKRFPGKQKRFKCFKLFPSPLKLLFAKSKRLCKFPRRSFLDPYRGIRELLSPGHRILVYRASHIRSVTAWTSSLAHMSLIVIRKPVLTCAARVFLGLIGLSVHAALPPPTLPALIFHVSINLEKGPSHSV